MSAPIRNVVRVARRAMACEFSVTFPASERNAVATGCAALDEIERIEEKLSVYRAGSQISRLNHGVCGRVDEEVLEVLWLASQIGRETGGAFGAAAGALVRAWGFCAGPRRVPSREEWQSAMRRTGMRHVALDRRTGSVRILRPGVEINLGAIGKGFAIDAAARLLRSRGVRAALIQGGGSSVCAIGSPPGEPAWRVAIGHPLMSGARLAIVSLKDRSLGTSGAANQFFEEGGRRYGHILDPRRGWPAAAVAGATVLGRSAAEADALSTAFFVSGVEGAREYCQNHRDAAAVLATLPRAGVVAFNVREKELKHETDATHIVCAAAHRDRLALPV